MEHEFPIGIPSGKTVLPFQVFRCSRKFCAGTTQKVVFHLLSNRIVLKIFVNGKQPITLCWYFLSNTESDELEAGTFPQDPAHAHNWLAPLRRPCADFFFSRIDLIHDTRHLCSHFRNDRIKAMSRGISAG